MLRALAFATTALVTLSATATSAEEAVQAELAGHAVLPAMTFVPAPAAAPAAYNVSGTFTGPGGTRVDELYALEGSTWLAAEDAPRTTGLFRPFVGQPVQGFSGIRALGDDRFLVLTDNGFGNKRNSPDAMLMFHVVAADWASGRVRLEDTVFLHDPDKVLPFRITNEFTQARYLTGSDFDVESIQPAGELYWFGDEFGPYLFATDATGRVVEFHEVEVDGEIVRSPDHYAVNTPSVPGEVTSRAWRSHRTRAPSTRCSRVPCGTKRPARSRPTPRVVPISASSSSTSVPGPSPIASGSTASARTATTSATST